jgi:hypothetical protein
MKSKSPLPWVVFDDVGQTILDRMERKPGSLT